jgi:hypothetical protein
MQSFRFTLVLAASLSCCLIAPPGWRDFASPDGKFEAKFPFEPKTTEVKTATGPLKSYLATSGTTYFGVSVCSLPDVQNPSAEAENQLLDSTRDAVVTIVRGKLLKETKIDLEKQTRVWWARFNIRCPGRELLIQLNDNKGQARYRLYVVEGQLYQVYYGTSDSDAAKSKDADTFFDSFKLKN